MNATNIGWTDLSANPVKYRDKRTGKTVWACVKASPGCAHCYAEALALRWNKGSAFLRPNLEHIEPFIDTSELRDMLSPKKLPPGKRVFIEDMSDLFGDWVPSSLVDELLAVLAIRSDVTFQLLTKRADRMADYFSDRGLGLRIAGKLMPAARGMLGAELRVVDLARRLTAGLAPGGLPNLLLGFSAENQEWFDRRWPHVQKLADRGWKVWTSFEPLLGPIDAIDGLNSGSSLSWAVVGGESGAQRRACEVEAINGIARQFKEAGVPIFVKQDADRFPGKQGRIPLDVWAMKEHPQPLVA